MLRRCLERDPKRRLQDIGDARLELEETASERSLPYAEPLARRPSRLSWVLAGVCDGHCGLVSPISMHQLEQLAVNPRRLKRRTAPKGGEKCGQEKADKQAPDEQSKKRRQLPGYQSNRSLRLGS
jgi:hypothetical protein